MKRTILYISQRGVGLLEALVAMGILLIIASSASVVLIHGFSSNRLADEEGKATLLAQEGIEAVRALKEQGWTNPFLTTNCSGGCGISSSGGPWAWNGSATTHGNFTRTITVLPVSRDGNGTIVETGGTPDPNSRKVAVDVSWDFSPTRHNSVALSTYLTYFGKPIGTVCTNWNSPLIVADTFNIDPGIQNASKVAANGDFAYIVRNTNGGTSPDLAIVNISNPTNITSEFVTDLNAGVSDVFYFNNLLFLATDRAGRQFWIIDVSNPASPNLDYAYATLPATARGVHVDGTYAYVVTQSNTGSEFFIFDIANLPTISGPWGVNLGVDGRAVYAEGNRALIATPNNSRELMIVDTTNKQAPLMNTAWSYNTPGCAGDGTGIFGIGDTAFLTTLNCSTSGQPEVYPLNIATYKTGVSLLGSGYDVGGAVSDIVVDSANQAYIATAVLDRDFMILNVANPLSITEIARANLLDETTGVHASGCIGVAATGVNTEELQVIIPSP